MSNLFKSKFLLGVMTVAVMFVGVVALNATKASADCSITMTLRQGSKGAEVMCLQTIVGATADGSFGPKTKTAVMAFQSSHGLTADGVVGPMTRAALMTGGAMGGNLPAGCTSTTGYSSTTGMPCSSGTSFPAGCTSTSGFSSTTGQPCNSGLSFPAGCTSTSGFSSTTGMPCSGGSSSSNGPLMGGAGSLDDVQAVSSLSDEKIAEGETNAKVAGWTITADNGSDLAITAIRLSFDNTSSGSQKLTKYADTVTIWQGSTKVGSAKVSDFTENSNVYSKTINLSGAVVKADKDSDFFVSVDALSNIDSSDLTSNNWRLTLESVRFEDATGAILTDSETGDIGVDGNIDFSFKTVASATGLELKVVTTTGSAGDAVNNGHVVDVDDTSDTNDVPLLAFDLKATGKIMNIQDIPVKIVSTNANGAGGVVGDASGFSLWKDGVQIDTVNAGDLTTTLTGSTACVTADNTCYAHFDDVDFDLNDGDTSHFVVKADVRDTTAGVFVDGDILTVTITSLETAQIDAEDDNGDSLSGGDLTGSATADSIAFYDKGIMVSLDGTPTAIISHPADLASAGDDDQATWTVPFKVTAFGDDMRIDDDCAEVAVGTSNAVASQVSFSLDGTSTIVATPPCVVTSLSGATHDTNSFLVEEGTTERFTLSVTGTASGDGYSNMKIEGISWVTGSADAAGTQIYTFNLDDFKTPEIFLNSN